MSYDISLYNTELVKVEKPLFEKVKTTEKVDFKKTKKNLYEEITTEVFESNYTYNVSDMLRRALRKDGINQFHGKKASECIETLEKGIADMKENKSDYEAMNPENGWGSYTGILKVLEKMLSKCKEYPNAEFVIS